MKILHLTDLHPTSGATKQKSGLRSADRNKAMVRDICNRASSDLQDTVVVISGDLMDERSADNVAFASAQIDELRKKFVVIVCPGNHDYYLPANRTAQVGLGRNFWGEFMLPMKNGQSSVQWKTPATEIDYPVQIDVGNDLSFLILDSNADAQGEKTSGALGRDQRDKLVERIMNVPADRQLVVVVHHDPIHVAAFKDGIGTLFGRSPSLLGKDRWALQAALRSRPADLLLCGHTHDPKLYVGADASEWYLRAASNGGTSTGHENGDSDMSESPFWLFDMASPEAPAKLSIAWK